MTFDRGTRRECASGKRRDFEWRPAFVCETLCVALAGRVKYTECFLATALHLDRHQQAKGDLQLVLLSNREITRTVAETVKK